MNRHDAASASDQPTGGRLNVDVLRGQPTAEELAALVAVVSESYARETADAIAEDSAAQTAWRISQRSLRTPLRRDIGWGRFGG